MTETLKISKYKKALRDRVNGRVFDDIKSSIAKTTKTKEEYFRKEKVATQVGSASLDSDILFRIPVSDGYIGGLYVEIIGATGVVYDVGKWGAQSCIKTIKFKQGNWELQYSGNDLVKMINIINGHDSIAIAELENLSGSGNVGTTPMITPILSPGNRLSYNSSAFDKRNPAWPIGVSSSPLDITITLKTGATISKTNAFQLGSIKLRYFAYSINSDDISSFRKIGATNGIYYSTLFIKPLSIIKKGVTLTDGIVYQFDFDSIIQDGELDALIISVLDKTTSEADMEYQDTQKIDTMKITIAGDVVYYTHSSSEHARMKNLDAWKITNKIYGTTSGLGYYYTIPMTGRPDLSIMFGNLGSKGLNLKDSEPTVEITCNTLQNSGLTHDVEILAIYKGVLSQLQSGDINMVTK